ncbi:MAG TPA: adenylate/guanylate cyclase domain-containing protein [Verrucomicrobiae bacterium]|nr:adenylate/guanylate cyclase domain-containing protein [Verrucomicrobiae bacterium]
MARAENLAIMFVDMAGFAERTARQSRVQNKNMLRDFNGLLVPLLARFDGRRIKSIGDALLVAFRSPTDSVRCGMAMQDAVAAYNYQRPEHDPLRIRVALNVGEVRLENDDVFGEAVNIAARVEELTPPGEIYLTGVTYMSMNKAEVPAEHIGEQQLKGIPEPVRLFRVPPYTVKRLTAAGESVPATPGEMPYGGMHLLPADSAVFERVADGLRRAPYVDWTAKARAVPTRAVLMAIAGVGLGATLVAMAYAVLAVLPAGIATQVVTSLPPAPVASTDEARAALTAAHTAYFERRRAAAAQGYAKVLEMDPRLRHDSGLAANLVGTLGATGELAADIIRKYPSPELTFELARRTGLPGRKGAQRAAALLTEQDQAGRIDKLGLAITELNEAPTCEERLTAVRSLRVQNDPRAVPALRSQIRRSFTSLFDDRNACLRAETEQAIADIEKGTSRAPAS